MREKERLITQREIEFRQSLYSAQGEVKALDWKLEQRRKQIGEKDLPTDLNFNPYGVMKNFLEACVVLADCPERIGTDPQVTRIFKDLLEKAQSSLPMLEGE